MMIIIIIIIIIFISEVNVVSFIVVFFLNKDSYKLYVQGFVKC